MPALSCFNGGFDSLFACFCMNNEVNFKGEGDMGCFQFHFHDSYVSRVPAYDEVNPQ